MQRRIKGSLFIDYVRMIRKTKEVEWSKYLLQEDMVFLDERILPSKWYPLESFERMADAVFRELAKGDLEVSRFWGRASLDALLNIYNFIIVEGDPSTSLQNLATIRSSFFDFDAIEVQMLSDNHVHVSIDITTNKNLEQAEAYQTLGSYERLIELAGGNTVRCEFYQKSWENDDNTIIELNWELPDKSDKSDEPDESDKSDEPDESDKSDEPDESDKSDEPDKSDPSDDSDDSELSD